jgi:hypothetical protein
LIGGTMAACRDRSTAAVSRIAVSGTALHHIDQIGLDAGGEVTAP